jgi:hypothetical protein
METRAAQIFKALCIGMLLDLLVTLAVGMLLGLIFAIFFFIQGVPDAEVSSRIQQLALSPGWFAFSVVTGASISVAAGFVAANFLATNIYPWLGLMGALLALIGFAGVGSDVSNGLAMGLSLVTLFSVMLGGHLWEWSQK